MISEREPDELVSISARELSGLRAAAEFLEALEAAGVDNWAGYEMAWEIMDGKEI